MNIFYGIYSEFLETGEEVMDSCNLILQSPTTLIKKKVLYIYIHTYTIFMTCKNYSVFLTITNGIMANNNDTTSRIHVHTNVYRIKLIMLNKLETIGVLTTRVITFQVK